MIKRTACWTKNAFNNHNYLTLSLKRHVNGLAHTYKTFIARMKMLFHIQSECNTSVFFYSTNIENLFRSRVVRQLTYKDMNVDDIKGVLETCRRLIIYQYLIH